MEQRRTASCAGSKRRLPPGASVFQLPYVPFPEGYPETPVSDQVATYATKYEPLRGYLHSGTCAGATARSRGAPPTGRPGSPGQPLPYVLAAAAAAGFDGLWVDPAGFEPAKAVRLRDGLRASCSARRPLASPDGDLWFFDLRPYLARLAHAPAGAAARAPARERPCTRCRQPAARAASKLVNPDRAPVAVTLSVRIAAHRVYELRG